jgi:hypothetical protein
VPIYLPEPLEHQQPAFDASCRYKILNCGRRWGKDRLEFTAGVAGHGPQTNGVPLFPGAAQGWTVVWLARDYTQAKGIWLEEFLPRFKPEPQVYTNEGDLRIVLPNGGSICIFSDKNVDSIRGLGKKVKGFITNEGAHFDLRHAWLRVVRPILADNQGWGLIASTPIAGSYFNELATQTLTGNRGRIAPTGPWAKEWGYWTGTIYDNPTIPNQEADALVAEYAPGSDVVREEIYAELLEGGSGLAFPEWDASVHLVEPFILPTRWRVAAGMDWGIRAPSVVLLCASDHEQNVVVFKEFMWKEKSAYDAGYDFASELLTLDCPWPEFLTCDSAMDDGSSRVGGQTILSEFQRGINDAIAGTHAPALWATCAPKGPGSRQAGYNLMKKMLAWGGPVKEDGTRQMRLKDGTIPEAWQPRLRIVGADCPYLAKTLPALRRKPSPKPNAEGVVMDGRNKDDIDDTQPDDHAYDGLRYYLQGLIPTASIPIVIIPEHVHPGFLASGARKSRERSPAVLREEKKLDAAYTATQNGKGLSGRYGPRPGRL